VAAHGELERVDNVELSPHVLEAGPYFWTNDGVLERPKVRTIIDDGRNFLMTTRETYDVILMEPPETFTAGVINLYTVEFYHEALAHLAPDGLMLQWIPTGQAPMDDERRLFAAFAAVFPHHVMWWQMNGGCVLLIGTRQPLRIDYQRLRTHMAEPQVARDMALSQIRDADHLLSMFIFDDAAFAGFAAGAPPTTDDRTVLDFSMPRYVGSGFGLGQFNPTVHDRAFRNPFSIVGERKLAYEALRQPVVPLLTNLGADTPEAVAQRIAERTALTFEPKWYGEADWPRRSAVPAPTAVGSR
jgi:spermidine synthase